ncbi:bifunctional diaminohydroxyphosphoribosylaminopyrimidine deaminase/5-amino-6-(5-phosphoribosylamino)uracil reductase RibD [Undibacter mobilis]|uniref:Riboflavin biosynthesis protein RibD n=1 Tax=Undibacter mobilis TaxID=2292256 RepID=A0A371B197_9BRAD|nr:bifunctional diaminohydroxyphosphoribosylaminopyrimidine deaminase/5-amino-6-(5-phosphoribosylamino)uracil reductase RibD [Undibacter mobilis]RDV01355.1 bifunctional diaminohydroxyphosphoribosylaminopyrimidine deaminase/5-amino-6-(5-phosphoribosylamino)uracil reductase RibD [Undibacter mobilis]
MSEAEAANSASSGSAVDERFMRLALSLGRRGLGNTWPNPAVGCVIVKDGVIVGRGWTQPGGRPHAEVEALRRAKRLAKGATAYVTLEPCSHEGKTPPCADAIIKAGVARVVSAIEDPNPEVAGQGHARLRDNGIVVDVGLCADEARRAHAGHIARITTSRPHVTLKLAVSADGKAGLAGRKQAVITGDEARNHVFNIRAQHDAILVGLGTVLADNPQLTARLPGLYERSPVRVVLDAQLRVPLSLSVISTVRDVPTWVFASQKASPVAEEILVSKGARVFRVDDTQGRLDLDEVMKVLGGEGITRLMVEGGPTVAASFVAADLVDEFVLLKGPKAIGEGGIGPLEGMALDRLTGKLELDGTEALGADTLEHYVRC